MAINEALARTEHLDQGPIQPPIVIVELLRRMTECLDENDK